MFNFDLSQGTHKKEEQFFQEATQIVLIPVNEGTNNQKKKKRKIKRTLEEILKLIACEHQISFSFVHRPDFNNMVGQTLNQFIFTPVKKADSIKVMRNGGLDLSTALNNHNKSHDQRSLIHDSSRVIIGKNLIDVKEKFNKMVLSFPNESQENVYSRRRSQEYNSKHNERLQLKKIFINSSLKSIIYDHSNLDKHVLRNILQDGYRSSSRNKEIGGKRLTYKK